MARPTAYDPKFAKKAKTYLKKCLDEEYIFHNNTYKDDNGNEKIYKSYVQRVKVNIPSKDGLAKYLNISRKTLYNWAEKHEDFSQVLELIDIEQKNRLINKGLEGTYNPVIAKLMLSSNHGMRDSIDATTNGESLNTFSDEQIKRIAERVSTRRDNDGQTSGE